jgi:hypothetical protein
VKDPRYMLAAADFIDGAAKLSLGKKHILLKRV